MEKLSGFVERLLAEEMKKMTAALNGISEHTIKIDEVRSIYWLSTESRGCRNLQDHTYIYYALPAVGKGAGTITSRKKQDRVLFLGRSIPIF